MKRALALVLMAALLLSPPLLVAASQEVVPNGVARIGAAPPAVTLSTSADEAFLDFADVGIAVVDTGIDDTIPDLNVAGGVDCSSATGYYSRESEPVAGGQRSIWDALPPLKKDANGAPIPDTEREKIVSLAGKRFTIATVGTNPKDLGGYNANATGTMDGNGHGTHVSGIAAARHDGQGVVGVAPNARLFAVKVLDSNGGGSLENVICGLDWVATNAEREGIHVVNMSLGMDVGERVMEVIEPCDTNEDDLPPYLQRTGKLKDEFHEAVCDVVDAGVVVVVAAGNGWGDSATTIPAAYPEVITVSNMADFDGKPGGLAEKGSSACPEMGGLDDTLWSHLNGSPEIGYGSYGGEAVDLAAPGVCVLSTFPGGVESLTGTSMASPHVAGAAARLIADDATSIRCAANVRCLLLANAEPQTDIFYDTDEWREPIVRVR